MVFFVVMHFKIQLGKPKINPTTPDGQNCQEHWIEGGQEWDNYFQETLLMHDKLESLSEAQKEDIIAQTRVRIGLDQLSGNEIDICDPQYIHNQAQEFIPKKVDTEAFSMDGNFPSAIEIAESNLEITNESISLIMDARKAYEEKVAETLGIAAIEDYTTQSRVILGLVYRELTGKIKQDELRQLKLVIQQYDSLLQEMARKSSTAENLQYQSEFAESSELLLKNYLNDIQAKLFPT